MVYANDQWVQLPVRSLYDSQMMLAAINAAKGEYERGLLDMKDFNKEYGDFLSPIQRDMDWYALNVTGKVKNAVDTMYANGIDLRSPEARAKLGLIINSVNPGDVAKLRQSAIAANEYIKNRGKLAAEGKYDPDQERFLTNGVDFSNWDTLGGNGIWNRTSPVQAKSLKELTQDWFDKRTAYELTADQAKRELGASYDPRKKYMGWLEEDLFNTAAQRIPGFIGSPHGQYFRERAKQQLEAYGYNNPTDEQIDAMLQKNVADANREYLIKPVGDIKEYLGLQELNLERQKLNETRRANNLKEQKLNEQPLGFTDMVRYGVGVSQQEKTAYTNLYKDLKAGLSKTGAKKQLIAEGVKNPTERQIKDRIAQNSQILRDNADVYSMNYAAYTTTPDGTGLLTARALAAGLTPEQVYESGITNIKGREVTFTPTGSLDLTKRREIAYAGQSLTKRSSTERLYNYLTGNNIKGSIADEDVSVSYKQFAPGHRIYDVNFKTEIKKSDLADLLRERYRNDDAAMLKSLSNSGCILKTKTGKEVDPNDAHKLVWSNIDKIIIPVSRTISANGLDESQIDVYSDAVNLGKSEASKRQASYQARDLLNMYNSLPKQ